MATTEHYAIIALDIGDKRIGVAHVDTEVRLPVAYGTLEVDGLEIERLREIITEVEPALIVVGYPRNQQGEPTAQTRKIVQYVERLASLRVPMVYQDESLTSVLAEDYLKSLHKPYSRGDIDAHAAAIILGDYLEAHFGKAA